MRIIKNNGQYLPIHLYSFIGNGINQLTGDVSAGPGGGIQAAILAAVNSDIGLWGDGSHVPQFTVDAKGRITAVTNVAIPGVTPQVQSDWNESNSALPDFIKNKPAPYSLPAATPSVRGGIRPDNTTITIAGDVISAPGSAGINQLTGDVVAGPGSGSQPATLATVNANVGTFGDATHVVRITLDAKGRVTAASVVAITPQAQSDWLETNTGLPDYIKNKPAPYVLPAATTSVRGGVRPDGSTIIIAGDVISAPGAGGGITQLTGDVLAGPGSGSQPATLKVVSTAGTYGDSTHVPQFILDAYGRVTSATPIAISGASTPTSMPKASDLGILANGTDQTGALNTIFANANYAGIIMDFSPANNVTISGNVNCGGKMIFYWAGSGFIGAGSITGQVIAAGYRQKLFALTVSLINTNTTTGKFSVWWYGATGSGDAQPAIQQSLNTCISNSLKVIYFPEETYTADSPILGTNWNGSSYAQWTVRFEGEESFWNGTAGGSVINFGYRNCFGIGIQGGKGVEIKQLRLNGLFTPPFTIATPNTFFTCAFSAFTDGVSRDTQYSPNCAICIDPFGPSVPSDGGYPGFNASAPVNYYRGGSGGSTGTIVEDCIMVGWVLGIITSPNGQTANAELCNFQKIQFDNMKACIVGCQAQEKLNVVKYAACWSNSHTFYHQGDYGIAEGGNWYLDEINIAGALNTFINRNSGGFFPMHVSKVYCESVGTVGTWTSGVGDSLDKSIFNFVTLDVFPQYPANTYFTSAGVTIKNSTFRMYGSGLPLSFNGGSFEDCVFEELPYGAGALINCGSGPFGVAINPTLDTSGIQRVTASRSLAGGKGRFIAKQDYIQGKQISLDYTDPNVGSILRLDGLNDLSSTVSITSNTATVTPPTAGDLISAFTNQLVIDLTTGNVMGLLTSIGGSTYTISYVPNGIVSGSYVLGIWFPIYTFSFMGDIVSGSNLIHNVVIDFGNAPEFIGVGGFVKIPGFYGYRALTQEARILSFAGGVITMDRNANETANGYYFSSNGAVKNIIVRSDGSGSGSTVGLAEILPKGSYFTDDVPGTGRRVYIVKTTGYFSNVPTAVLTQLNP
jgi:hypothetical protein